MQSISLRAACLLLALMGLFLAPAGSRAMELRLDTNQIHITTFYNGTTVQATGSIAPDQELLLQVVGPKTEVHLKEKGKVAGFLWMNKQDVTLAETPSVYMVYTPGEDGDALLGPGVGVGYDAVRQAVEIEPESEDKAFVFGEFVKLMEKYHVYGIHRGAVVYEPVRDGRKPFTVTLEIPPKMTEGDYRIEAVAVADGHVVDRAAADLHIEMTALPAWLARLAYGRPLLFGVMSVCIAVATGLLIGAVFKGGGGSH